MRERDDVRGGGGRKERGRERDREGERQRGGQLRVQSWP